MIKRFRTAWPHVTVKIMDEATGKPTIAAFGMDVIVPLSADPDDVKRLAAKGAIVAVEQPEPELEPAKEKADDSKRVSVKPKSNGS
jgi:hypothetical protein